MPDSSTASPSTPQAHFSHSATPTSEEAPNQSSPASAQPATHPSPDDIPEASQEKIDNNEYIFVPITTIDGQRIGGKWAYSIV